jgi:hypothetical protein
MRTLLLGFLAGCAAASGDPCGHSIDMQWGTSGDDEALALIPARSSGVYVAGYAGGTPPSGNLRPAGNSRGFVRKLDPSGAVQWEATLDTSGADAVEALAEVADGTLYAAGRTTGAFPGAIQAGQFDTFVAVLDGGRSIRTVRQFGDERPQHPRRLALFGTRLLLAGFDDVYVPTNYVEDWENWFAASLSAADLQEAWRVAPRTAFPDVATAILVDTDGSTYVAGSSSGGTQPGIWLRKLDALGQEVWGSRLTSSGLDTAAALAFAKDGTLVLGGTHFGGSQPVLISVDRGSGAPRWRTSGPRDLNGTSITDIATDAEGNVYAAGGTATAIAPRYVNRGLYDPFVMRFDAGGALTGTWQGGSAADEEPTAVSLDSCGRVLVAGWTDGVVAGGASSGRRDAFLLSARLEPE